MADSKKPEEEQFNELCLKLAGDYREVYARHCTIVPKMIAITVLSGALAAKAAAAGYKRNNVIDAINSAFDDIE